MVTALPPHRFRELLAEAPPPPLIDTRPATDFDAWHIPGAINIPTNPDQPLDREALDAAVPEAAEQVLTVCAWGISSFDVAEQLEELGHPEVAVLSDGMVAWSKVYDIVDIEVVAGVSIYQLQRLAKGCLGYLVGCDDTGEAIAIDTPIHLEAIERTIEDEDLDLVGVVDTHIHADHIAGGPTLADEHDVPYYIGTRAIDRGFEYDHVPLADGETLDVGEHTLSVCHTPGHTTEMISLVLEDDALIFTADTLFVDGVGRTELEETMDPTTQTRDLYRSLMDVLFERAPDANILPGHFDPGGSELIAPTTPIIATLAEVRDRLEPILTEEDSFVEHVMQAKGERPPNYRAIIQVNRGRGRPPGREVISQLELGPNRCAVAG